MFFLHLCTELLMATAYCACKKACPGCGSPIMRSDARQHTMKKCKWIHGNEPDLNLGCTQI